MNSRGPDRASSLTYKQYLHLGHLRLAINDLSSSGNQPMESSCGRFLIIFNGEIYNHKILWQDFVAPHNQIDNIPLSDTRTLIELIAIHGLDFALQHINGMFAFLLLDVQEDIIYGARDSSGEKPLYYKHHEGSIICSSELKSIVHIINERPKINAEAVSSYLHFGYVPSPISIYENVYKLTPGNYFSHNIEKNEFTIVNFNTEFAEGNLQSNDNNDFKQITFEDKLYHSVKSRLLSDVPIATFMSGGIDSTAITAVYSDLSSKPIDAYTVAFENSEWDESHLAKEVARKLKVNHHIITVEQKHLNNALSEMPYIFDEPFCDPSQFPTYTLTKFVGSNYKVALSGDGGDELLLGYSRHIAAYSMHKLNFLPDSLRRQSLTFLKTLLPIVNYANDKLAQRYRVPNLPRKLEKLKLGLDANTAFDFYLAATSYNAEYIKDNSNILTDFLQTISMDRNIKTKNLPEAIQELDRMIYLPDNICTKVDRLSMAASLEVRAPLLDKELIDYCYSLPLGEKLNSRGGKKPLIDFVSRRIGSILLNRPKRGFGMQPEIILAPLTQMFPLNDAKRFYLVKNNFLTTDYLAKLYHLSNENLRNAQLSLINILMFEHWIHSSYLSHDD